jgi:hypothetical protein
MSTTEVKVFSKRSLEVEACQYDGTPQSMATIISWVEKRLGVAFPAAELDWRHDYGTYWHLRHGHIYLPQGGKRIGGRLVPLGDDELVVLTGSNTFALAFPGDYVVRGRSGFYPLSAESFHRSHILDPSHRGIGLLPLPAV